MGLFAFGINHTTASVELRERVAFAPQDTARAMQQAIVQAGVDELVILSTCNRTELYGFTPQLDSDRVLQWLADYHQLPQDQLQAFSYIHQQEAAVQHIMRVASGLDSMVLGEPQILGQLKSAYAVAQDANTLGRYLERLFQHSFAVAKQVRTETAIGQNPVSVAYAAVNLAQRIFADLSETQALLIGAGDTIDLVARHLQQNGVKDMVIANRTLQRAQDVAENFGAQAVLLSDIPEQLVSADIVVASTASQLPILGKGAVERALKQRKHRLIYMVDIAVPRDIEPEVGELPDVYLYSVDDLQQVIEENIRSRQEAAEQAEHIIVAGVEGLMRQLRALDAGDMVRLYREKASDIRQGELDKALKQLQNGQDPQQVLQSLANILTNKLIHGPSAGLRKLSAEGDTEQLDWAQDFFELNGTSANGRSSQHDNEDSDP